MATVEELLEQYKIDRELQKEVDGILADQKITVTEFMGFVKNHDLKMSIKDFPEIIRQAREAGLIK